MCFLGIETPRPSRELDVVVVVVVAVGCCSVCIDKLRGASSDDVMGLPINELTSKASGLPLTVWLLAFVPLLTLLFLLLGKRSSWTEEEEAASVVECLSCVAFFAEEENLFLLSDWAEELADWTDCTAAAMAGGMASEANGLPKKG